METSAQPVSLVSETNNVFSRGTGNDGTVTDLKSTSLSPEEEIFVRYTTDGWTTSSFVEASGTGTTFTATILDAVIIEYNGNDEYYVLTTPFALPTYSIADIISIKINNKQRRCKLSVTC